MTSAAIIPGAHSERTASHDHCPDSVCRHPQAVTTVNNASGTRKYKLARLD